MYCFIALLPALLTFTIFRAIVPTGFPMFTITFSIQQCTLEGCPPSGIDAALWREAHGFVVRPTDAYDGPGRIQFECDPAFVAHFKDLADQDANIRVSWVAKALDGHTAKLLYCSGGSSLQAEDVGRLLELERDYRQQEAAAKAADRAANEVKEAKRKANDEVVSAEAFEAMVFYPSTHSSDPVCFRATYNSDKLVFEHRIAAAKIAAAIEEAHAAAYATLVPQFVELGDLAPQALHPGVLEAAVQHSLIASVPPELTVWFGNPHDASFKVTRGWAPRHAEVTRAIDAYVASWAKTHSLDRLPIPDGVLAANQRVDSMAPTVGHTVRIVNHNDADEQHIDEVDVTIPIFDCTVTLYFCLPLALGLS